MRLADAILSPLEFRMFCDTFLEAFCTAPTDFDAAVCTSLLLSTEACQKNMHMLQISLSHIYHIFSNTQHPQISHVPNFSRSKN